MLVAVLCPGPSLARLTVPPPTVTIAVNRAALAFAADLWVALDYQTVLRDGGRVRGGPLLLIGRHERAKYAKRPGPDLETLAEFAPDRLGWRTFGSTAALVLAGMLGATTVRAYGVDWAAGQPDHDGVAPAGADRAAERFATEARIWRDVTAWLAARGVAVERIQ